MGVDFPIPRDQLPQIRVSEVEHDARKLQMERMLLQTLVEYDQMRDVTTDATHVDPLRWKQVGSRNDLLVYRERTSSVLAQYGPASTVATSSYSNSANEDYYLTDPDAVTNPGGWLMGGRESTSSLTGRIIGAAHGDPANKGEPAREVRGMLVVGEMPGQMENVLSAVVTQSPDEYMLVSRFTVDDLADAAIVHILEGPSSAKPYHFLGYKWLVKKPTRVARNRDSLYMDYSGLTTTSQGETMGFHFMHSVEHPDFPHMTDHNCVRATQSLRFLYRQRRENVIQVFMVGEVDLPSARFLRPLISAFSTDVLACVSRLVECAEARRLTRMVLRFRTAREDWVYTRRGKVTACTLCQQKKKFYNTVSLIDCTVCGHLVCSRCRMQRSVYISDGALGRFERVRCCRSCISMANKVGAVKPRGRHSRQPSSSSSSSSSRQRQYRPPPTTEYMRHRGSIPGVEIMTLDHPPSTAANDETRTQRSASDSSTITADMAMQFASMSPRTSYRSDTSAIDHRSVAYDAHERNSRPLVLSDWMASDGRRSDSDIQSTARDSEQYPMNMVAPSSSAPSTPTVAPSTTTEEAYERPLTITVTMGASSAATPYSALPRPGGGMFYQTFGSQASTRPRHARQRPRDDASVNGLGAALPNR